MEKIFKEVSFGKYEVNQKGRVRKIGQTKELLFSKSGGYFIVRLNLGRTFKMAYIHRLVAEAFIPNPDNKPLINHKNCIKTDNNIDNLEWCTNQENIQHAWDNGLFKNSGKKVECIQTFKKWDSIKSCAKDLGLDESWLGLQLSGKKINTTSLRYLKSWQIKKK